MIQIDWMSAWQYLGQENNAFIIRLCFGPCSYEKHSLNYVPRHDYDILMDEALKTHSSHNLNQGKYARVHFGEHPNSWETYFNLSFAHNQQKIKHLEQCTYHHGQTHQWTCEGFAR
jgi:hypothetical protein